MFLRVLSNKFPRTHRFSSMLQLPLAAFGKTRFMKDRKTLGNTMFWIGEYLDFKITGKVYANL